MIITPTYAGILAEVQEKGTQQEISEVVESGELYLCFRFQSHQTCLNTEFKKSQMHTQEKECNVMPSECKEESFSQCN